MEVLGRVDLSSWFQWQFCHFNYGHYGHCSSVPCPHGRVPRHAAQQHESAVRGETDWLRSLLRIISLQPSFSLSAVSSSGNHVQNVFRYKLCTYYIWWHSPLPITPRQGPGYLVVRCHNTTPPDSWRPAGSRVAAIKTVSIRNADHEYIQLREQFLGMASLLPYLYRICWVELGDKIGIMTVPVPGQAGCQPVAHFLIPLLKYLSKYF